MNITYHPQVASNGNETYFPHNCLHISIQEYIEERKVKTKEYLTSSNGHYLFIYLPNGDRIDVAL